jgi:hypothetical protein
MFIFLKIDRPFVQEQLRQKDAEVVIAFFLLHVFVHNVL